MLLPIAGIFVQSCTNNTKDSTDNVKSTAETVFAGDKGDAVIENLPWDVLQKIKKGDIVWTKSPELFLDFNYSVAYNDYNSAVGKFAGWDRKVVGYQQETTLFELLKKAKSNTATQAQ